MAVWNFQTAFRDLADFEGTQTNQHQDDGDNPETDDDLGFFPAFLFVMMMNRRHQKDAFFGAFVPTDL